MAVVMEDRLGLRREVSRGSGPRMAIVHDSLVQWGGAEKVVEVLHGMFPEAPVYTSVYDPAAMPAFYREWDIRCSFMQRLPMKSHLHRAALMLYPLAIETLDLGDYDLVISSSSRFAKGVITPPDAHHISYTYTPMRFAWHPDRYADGEKNPRLTKLLLQPAAHYLRTWDCVASNRVDQFIAISRAVESRIRKFYRRDSQIIYPPVETDHFTPVDDREIGNYYIVVSRFAPYKRLDLAVEAFTRLGRPLKVVGSGRQNRALKSGAGPNVEFLGHVSSAELRSLVARSRAFILPGEEDFCIAAVEANSAGRPVIAYAAGGALDTQVDGLTGVLFHPQSVEGLVEAVERADAIDFDPTTIRQHARRFDVKVFRERMMQLVESQVGVKS